MKLPRELILALAIVLSPSCGAQATGSLRVIVTDLSGGAIPHTHVRVTGAKIAGGTTDSNGSVLLASLPAGKYEVIAKSAGFRDGVSDVTIASGKSAQLLLKLEVAPPDPSGIQSLQTFDPRLYSNFLQTVKESGLCKEPIPAHAQFYRFLWLPTFDHPIFMRVDVGQDGTAVLQVKVLSGTGGYGIGHTETTSARKLSNEEEEDLFLTLADIGFWTLPSTVKNLNPSRIILDGTDWAIEGVRDGNCHVVTRYASPLTLLFEQYFLGEIAKLKPYYNPSQ